ncbi:MAG: response regulator [Bacteroidetes bacterium]|nr:response regulator [Bacteroidota bacterium]
MKRICIIDDDFAHRRLLEYNLTSQNYEVLSFSKGAEFLNETFPEMPFAIILDHYLKDEKTGLEYLADIKKKMPNVPVIFMTNETDENLIKQVVEIYASQYIAKDPASFVRLRTLLDEIQEKSKGSWLSRIFKKLSFLQLV